MNTSDYLDKLVTIKSTGVQGTIKEVLRKRGSGGGLAIRFLVIDASGTQHELCPHEVTIQ